ncbi:hypothetical protein CPB83DRAFT_858905 [Crepidotus variabilis]|uniref:Large ribosomal subunit protein uL30m n=1 Tax=Crepidotus variabilis TaxID=179855 RepID=A0A9P6JML8_9AGAR|nr:hypothetical protein CPB83DRAFT_858905 [Crepidotus variabilis]
MALNLCRRQQIALPLLRFNARRALSTATLPAETQNFTPSAPTSVLSETPNTHFKITLRRSGISMGKKIQGTLLALGFHRRHQTVYHPHSPEIAGKILRVKELVEVENVPTQLALTKQQQRQARKAPSGFEVVGLRRDNFMNV